MTPPLSRITSDSGTPVDSPALEPSRKNPSTPPSPAKSPKQYIQNFSSDAFAGFHSSSSEAWFKQSPLIYNPATMVLGVVGCGGQDGKGTGSAGEGQNQPPKFENHPGSHLVTFGSRMSFDLRVSDPDGDDVEVRMEPVGEYPDGARFSRVSKNQYEFEWTPTRSQGGDYLIDFIASDGTHEVDVTATITVAANPDGDTLEEACSAPSVGKGSGTPEDPYEFRILVAMDESARMAIEANGWDIEAGVDRMFAGLNAAFNNGQLEGHYDFIPIGIRYYDDWQTNPYPEVDTTEEIDDGILLFDPQYYRHGEYSGGGRVTLSDLTSFDPNNTGFRVLIHEWAHFLGAHDLYAMGLTAQENQVYPGQGYEVSVPSYMQADSQDGMNLTWDPMTAGILDAAANDPEKGRVCRSYWMGTWIPENLSIQVVDATDNPVSGAEVEIYRHLHWSEEPLSSADRWFSGQTDGAGRVPLPTDISLSDSWFYATFLGAITFSGETYLKWFDITHLTIPYIEGQNNLVLDLKADDSSRYDTGTATELEISSLQADATTLQAGDTVNVTFTVTNHGPQPLDGDLTIQNWIGPNPELDDMALGNGGKDEVVHLQNGESMNFDRTITIRDDITPGTYYLMVEIFSRDEGVWETDSSDNLAVSVPVTITA